MIYGTALFTITVENTGRLALHDVNVVNLRVPTCSRTIKRLASGATHTYRCLLVALRSEPGMLFVASATPVAGGTIKAGAKASVVVRAETVGSGSSSGNHTS